MNIRKVHVIRICILLFMVCGIFLLSGISVHGAAAPYATGVISDQDGVNVRSSYSTDASIVTSIGHNASVTIVRERFTSATSNALNTRWYYIQYHGYEGWVRADLVTVSHSVAAGKTTAGVNIRKGAGTSFDSVATLSSGDDVKVRLTVYSAQGYKWYKVLYNGYNRYIRATYVKLEEPSGGVEGGSGDSVIEFNTDFEHELSAFPSSYHAALRTLHEKYPTWHFKANTLPFTWNEALREQTSSYAVNTIPSSKPDAYKAVAQGTYDFDGHYYYGLDGSSWVAASKKTVAYYMDPRNWLDEINVFMFESLGYDGVTQTENMVKALLANTAINPSYSASYMVAGSAYGISPVYLAAKSRLELGSSSFMVDGHEFTYNGKTYKGYYNAYNIGASDSADGSAALKGLYYAASGTSYLRPWNTLDKAIRGGAKYIAEAFIGNHQHTLYYERFNVANGLSNIGTHQYMTNTMAAATQANITYWNYSDNGMLNTAFTFEIPVFQSMPEKVSAAPGSGNNNCFLDSLKVYNGNTRLYFKTSFDRFTSTYTLKTSVGAEVKDLTVKAVTNASDAKAAISGNTDLVIGENKIKVKVTSSAGIVKNYYIHVTKLSTSSVVVAPEIKLTSDAETGKPVISWDRAVNADQYKVYRSTSRTGTYTLMKTTTALSYTDKKAEVGSVYYYKVKSVGTSGVVGEATSEIKYRTCDLPRPKVKTGNRASDGYPQLKWAAVDGAVKYEVYRADSIDGAYTKMYTQTSTTYTNTKGIETGKTYYYKVAAIHEKSAANSAYSEAAACVCALPQPVVTAGNRESDGKPQLKWAAINGAVKYEIYRAETENGTYSKMYTTANTVYTNTTAKAGKTYYYKVKAMHENPSANSADSAVQSASCLYAELVLTSGNRASDGKPKLTWNVLDGAEKYEVYRATSKDGTYKKMYTTTKNTYTNTKATVGERYYYQVKAYGDVSETGEPIFSNVVYRVCDLPQPVLKTSIRESDGKIKLSWTAVEDADKYMVYVATSKNGTYEKIATKTGTSHVHKKAVAGVRYYYKVKAICADTSAANSAYSGYKYRTCKLGRPVVSVARRSSDGKPKLTWAAVEGADSYDIYYATSKNGSYKKLYTRTGTVHTHTKAAANKTYYYKVKAIFAENSNANSAYSKVKYIKSK